MKKLFIIILVLVYSQAWPQQLNQLSGTGEVSEGKEIPAGFSKAMEFYNKADYTRAYTEFEKFYSYYGVEDELSASAKYYAAESLLKLGQTNAAIPALEYFISRYEWSSFRDEALYQLGTLYFESGKYAMSREKLRMLLDNYPQSTYTGSAMYWIGEAYSREDNLQDAVKFFEEALASRKNNKYIDNSIYALANIYEKTGDYTQAVKYYDELLAYYKSSSLAPYAQIRIGLCYFKLKDYDNAILELTDPMISELPPALQTEANYILGSSYYRLSEFNDAAKTFTDIIGKDPSAAIIRDVRYSLGWVYFQQEKYDEAYKIFNLLSKDASDTTGINSLYWSGEAKRYAGSENEALEIFRQFMEQYPNHPLASRVNYLTGVTQYGKNKLNSGEKFLLSAAASDDENTRARAYIALGEMKLTNSVFDEAKKYFSQAYSQKGIIPDLQNRAALGMGVALYFLNDYDGAISYLKNLSLSNPGFEKDKVRFYLAEAYSGAKDYPNALKNYNQVEQGNLELKPRVIYGKAYAYFNMKDFVNASNYFSEFTKQYKNDKNYTDARLRLADSYYGNKKYTLAGNIYKEVYLNNAARGKNDYAYYQYAQALYKAGKMNEAISEFRALQDKFPASSYIEESQYLIGWIYFQKTDYRSAINNYKPILSRFPESSIIPVTLNSIANSYFNMGAYDSALVYYNTVASRYPSTQYSLEAVNGIKDAYLASGKTTEAVQVLDDYSAESGKTGYADQLMFKKGELYYDLKDYEKAKEAYKNFISAYPKSQLIPDAHYWVGKCAEGLNQSDEALYHFNIVYNSYLNTDLGVASVLELGKIYSEQKNYDAAIRVYQKVKDKMPESPKLPEIMFSKAQAHIANQDITSAYQEFNSIIQNYDDSYFTAASKVEFALLEMVRKNYESCDMLLKEVAESNNEEMGAKAQYYYGVSLMEQGKTDDAISAFVRVKFAFSKYDEWLTRSFLSLGDAYQQKGDMQNAREMYRIVLTRHTDDEFGTEAQNKLRLLK